MFYFAFPLLIFLHHLDLQSLVPSLGGMVSFEPFVPPNSIPGARVASPTSGEDESPAALPACHDRRAKLHEAWATVDLGLVQSRNRCNRLKRSHIRGLF